MSSGPLFSLRTLLSIPHKDNIAAPQLRLFLFFLSHGSLAARRSARVIHNIVAPRLGGRNKGEGKR